LPVFGSEKMRGRLTIFSFCGAATVIPGAMGV
jgi:hypothetical protein